MTLEAGYEAECRAAGGDRHGTAPVAEQIFAR
jgi:hypothetical protein